MKAVLLAHLAATLFMTGVIWFVQIVHYPLFGAVNAASFNSYAATHGRLTTYVVVAPMLVELATGALLLWQRPVALSFTLLNVGFTLIIIVWLSTFFLQVPQHDILNSGFDGAAHRTLVITNWVRTAAWTLRSALVLWMVARVTKV